MDNVINVDIEQNSVISMGVSGDESLSTGTSSLNNLVPLEFDDSEAITVDMELNDNSESMEVDIGIVTSTGNGNDYRKLINKPKINGTTLVDNYNEIDPTVPAWAKSESKPDYTADEVGAIDEDAEMSFSTVKEVWDSIFNKGD